LIIVFVCMCQINAPKLGIEGTRRIKRIKVWGLVRVTPFNEGREKTKYLMGFEVP